MKYLNDCENQIGSVGNGVDKLILIILTKKLTRMVRMVRMWLE